MKTLFCRSICLRPFTAIVMLVSGIPVVHAQCGKASWYQLPGRTASGQFMSVKEMTAAHRSLPFGSKVEVINRKNGKRVVVRINDRGPFVKGRVIDVSKAAAAQLGFIRSGHTNVCLKKIG